MGTKERESGLELLRLLSTFAVVFLHYNSNFALDFVLKNSINYYFLLFVESISIVAVNVFILISGFFMYNSEKRIINKPIELLFQVILFKVGFYCISRIFSSKEFVIKDFLFCFIPNNYFVILYITLYFISPYINKLLSCFESRTWKYFFIINGVLFFVFSTLVDLFTESFNIELMGISPITAWGNFQGFNIVQFVLMYCIGAYLKYCKLKEYIFPRKKLLCIWGTSVILIFLWSLLNEHLSKHGLRSAWVYHNPLVVISSISLFLFFSSFSFRSRIINTFSRASFFCFLIHGYFLQFAKIQTFVNRNAFVLLVHIIITCLIIYVISFIIFEVYSFIDKILFVKIPKREIKYFEENEIDDK